MAGYIEAKPCGGHVRGFPTRNSLTHGGKVDMFAVALLIDRKTPTPISPTADAPAEAQEG